MKKFYLFVFIVVLFILQFSVLGVFFDLDKIPNLFVAFTVGLSVLFGFRRSIGWVVLAGLLMDSGSPWLLGSGALLLVLVLWFIEKVKVVAELRSGRYYFVLLFSLLVFFSSFLFDAMVRIGIRVESYFFQNMLDFGGSVTDLDHILKYLYSAILGVGVYYFIRKAKAPLPAFPAAQKLQKKQL